MDSGAYGSYPSYTRRRRYGFGKYLNRKYAGALAPYRRRRYINPLNQFTYKKTRIGKYTKTQMASIKATYTDRIVLQPSSYTYTFDTNDLPYRNLTDILQLSPEWVSRQTQYSFYMINGISVAYTRMWMDPVAYGVNGATTGFTEISYTAGLQALNSNFYPNLTSTVVGQPVQQADSSWITSPFIVTKQTHYQPFPKNFTTGVNSNGLGVWNACNQIANLAGEIAIYNDNGAQPSDMDHIRIFDVEINVYVSFCNNTGT